MSATEATAFADIPGALDDLVPCIWYSGRLGRTCARRASWNVNVHGCQRATLCTQHFRAWVQRAERRMAKNASAYLYCEHCGRQGKSVAELCTAVRL